MVGEYRAEVRRVAPAELGRELAGECDRLGLRRVVVPPALPVEWRPDGVELLEDHGLSAAELDEIDGALTGCAAAIAETGTLVLDGRGASGRRAITLVPDHHICVVRAEQIVGLVPEAIARVADAVRGERAPITLVSGPSATSDIELDPRRGRPRPAPSHRDDRRLRGQDDVSAGSPSMLTVFFSALYCSSASGPSLSSLPSAHRREFERSPT